VALHRSDAHGCGDAHSRRDETEARLVAGQSYRRPPGVEHDVMNGSSHPIAFVEVEIKRPEALAQA
jgi:mannose-6-phosphate isomerase-like protein (cupin superfamily)